MGLENINVTGLSVVICCYNSESRIVPTIEHLLKQNPCPFPWEVLMVDNSSTDRTVDLARNLWNRDPIKIPMRIVHEPRKGTMYARQTGIELSKYRYLLFCDDDNWLADNYLNEAYRTITKDYSIAAVGGLGEMVFDPGFTPPSWIHKFGKNYGTGPQGDKDGDTTNDKGCLYTAGAILDRVWLDKLYAVGFQPSLRGRDGRSLVAGEDTELTYALKLIGGRLHYSSAMKFRHYMPPNRMTWDYLSRLSKSFGYSDFLLTPYRIKLKNLPRKGVFRLIISTMLKTAQFGSISMLSPLKQGNPAILYYYRLVGKLQAAFRYRGKFNENESMVNKISSKLNTTQSEV